MKYLLGKYKVSISNYHREESGNKQQLNFMAWVTTL